MYSLLSGQQLPQEFGMQTRRGFANKAHMGQFNCSDCQGSCYLQNYFSHEVLMHKKKAVHRHSIGGRGEVGGKPRKKALGKWYEVVLKVFSWGSLLVILITCLRSRKVCSFSFNKASALIKLILKWFSFNSVKMNSIERRTLLKAAHWYVLSQIAFNICHLAREKMWCGTVALKTKRIRITVLLNKYLLVSLQIHTQCICRKLRCVMSLWQHQCKPKPGPQKAVTLFQVDKGLQSKPNLL